MIKKRNASLGLNTNVNIDPSASSNASANASPNISNHIYIRDFRKDDKIPNKVMSRDISLDNINEEVNEEPVIEEEKPKKQKAKIYAREVIIKTESKNNLTERAVETPKTAEQLILETYAKILLDQNKSLLLNLISKNTIMVPKSALENIIAAKVGKTCEIVLENTDESCCIAKYSPIKKVESIKIINDELVSDFKQVYNNDYNDLVNLYYLCLKFAIDA